MEAMDADSDIYIRPPTFRVYLCIMALCTGINAITAFPDKSDTAGNTQVRPIL